jgi:hypothetical protein
LKFFFKLSKKSTILSKKNSEGAQIFASPIAQIYLATALFEPIYCICIGENFMQNGCVRQI